MYNPADICWDVLNDIMSLYYLHIYRIFGLKGLIHCCWWWGWLCGQDTVPKGWKTKNDCTGSTEHISTKRRSKNMLNMHQECTYTVNNDGGGHGVEIPRKLVPKGWKTENDCTGSMEHISTKQRGKSTSNMHLECTYTVANDGGGHVVEIQRKPVLKGWKTEMTVQVQWGTLAQNNVLETC